MMPSSQPPLCSTTFDFSLTNGSGVAECGPPALEALWVDQCASVRRYRVKVIVTRSSFSDPVDLVAHYPCQSLPATFATL